MDDRYPGVLFNTALEALYDRFGSAAIRYLPSNGNVFIEMPLVDGGTFHVGLTWQQGKYLAFKPQLRG